MRLSFSIKNMLGLSQKIGTVLKLSFFFSLVGESAKIIHELLQSLFALRLF